MKPSRRRREGREPRLAAGAPGRPGIEYGEEPTSPFATPLPPKEKAAPDPLDRPDNFINRELSLLDFHGRVLAQAKDPKVPLLERLRFLTIFCSNLDEFFEIRVSGLKEQVRLGFEGPGPDGLTPRECLREITRRVNDFVAEQYRVLNQEIVPELEREGITLYLRRSFDDDALAHLRAYFRDEVLPVLTPVALDPAHPFPLVVNKSLNFIVTLKGRDAFGRATRVAVVQAPRVLPRLIRLPAADPKHERFATLSGVIQACIGDLFPDLEVTGCYQFRVTRNSDLMVDESEIEDLLSALSGELRYRHFGDAVRLEVNQRCPPEMTSFLLEQFGTGKDDLFAVDGPVNLGRLDVLYDMVDRLDLKYPPFTPAVAPEFVQADSVFDVIRRKDVVLHHPYDAFTPVMTMLKEAATDPEVLAVKITLYRIGSRSPLTDTLLEAARNGKEVTAVVELRARFDEEANIGIARRLQEAGAKVAYGIVGYKTHAKLLLVVRREEGRLRRYVHLGTGNYHLRTTRQYTDFGLMTADPALGEDVHLLFNQLTGLGQAKGITRLLESPFTLHDRMIQLIEREAEAARRGEPAHVMAKLNSLVEPGIIKSLYRASAAGVRIDLVVRGMCCLKPGVPGLSEHVRVRSIVGRFLEHPRIFHFHAGGRNLTYCSSADWAPRNFFRRVETAFPIDDEALKKRILEDGIEVDLQDNVQAWDLGPDGTWTRRQPAPGEEPRCAQTRLLRSRG